MRTVPISPSAPRTTHEATNRVADKGPTQTCRSAERDAHNAGTKVDSATTAIAETRSGSGNPSPVLASNVAAVMNSEVPTASAAKPTVALPGYGRTSSRIWSPAQFHARGFSSIERPECIRVGRDLALDATALIENVAGRSPNCHGVGGPPLIRH